MKDLFKITCNETGTIISQDIEHKDLQDAIDEAVLYQRQQGLYKDRTAFVVHMQTPIFEKRESNDDN